MSDVVLPVGGLSMPECSIICSECKCVIQSRDSLGVRFDVQGRFIKAYVCVDCFGDSTEDEALEPSGD